MPNNAYYNQRVPNRYANAWRTANSLYTAGKAAYNTARFAQGVYRAGSNYFKSARSGSRRVSTIAKTNRRTEGLLGLTVKYTDSWYIGDVAVSDPIPQLIPMDSLFSGTCVHLTPISQGSGETERVGKTAYLKSMNIKWALTTDGGAITGATSFLANQHAGQCTATLFIVEDNQCNGASPANSAVFENPNGSVYLSGVPNINLEYRERFRIIKTQTIRYTPTITNYYRSTGAVYESVVGRWTKTGSTFINFGKPVKQTYDNTGSGNSSVTNKAYYAYLAMPIEYNPPSANVVLQVKCRTRFTG